MYDPDDTKKLEEEASRLAKDFPTLTGALLWLIAVAEEHHQKLDILRNAVVIIGGYADDAHTPGFKPPSEEELKVMLKNIRESLGPVDNLDEPSGEDVSSILKGIIKENSTPTENLDLQSAISGTLFSLNKKDDDDPTVH